MAKKQYTNKTTILIEMFKKGSNYSDETPYSIQYTYDMKKVDYIDRSKIEGFDPTDFFPIFFDEETAEYFVEIINIFLKNKKTKK